MRSAWFNTLLAAVLVSTLSSVGLGLQLSELRDNVRLRVRDTTTDTTRQQFSDAQINVILNEGQRQVVNSTWLLQDTTTFGLTNGTRTYTLPSDFLAVMRVTLSGKALTETTEAALDAEFNGTDWTVTSSTPTKYYVDRSTNVTTALISFYAKPSTTSVNSCVVDYAKKATDLSSDTDLPYNGKVELYQYHDVLVDYAAGTLWLIQGMPELAKGYLELYGAKLANIKSNLGQMPNYNPSVRGDRGTNR